MRLGDLPEAAELVSLSSDCVSLSRFCLASSPQWALELRRYVLARQARREGGAVWGQGHGTHGVLTSHRCPWGVGCMGHSEHADVTLTSEGQTWLLQPPQTTRRPREVGALSPTVIHMPPTPCPATSRPGL